MWRLFFVVWVVLIVTCFNSVIGQALIEKGSVWKYLDNGSDQDTSWKDVGFNDSTWKSGPAILGYGTFDAGPVSTTLSYGADSNNKYVTTYFRTNFDYEPSGNDSNFIFNVLVDDGAIIYINGKEVLRINMSGGQVYYNTFASAPGNDTSYQTIIVPTEDLACVDSGQNIIAVELHQSDSASSDLGWDCELLTSHIPVKNITQIRFGSTGEPLNGLTITWRGNGSADKIAWGLTKDFEEGEFQGLKRDQNASILFDYTFPDLQANSIIHYTLFDSKDSIWTEERTFKTASDTTNNKFSFTAFGDSRTYPEEWKIISEATLETDFTLFLGDIIASGASQSDWDAWFEYGEKFIGRELIYHTIGNHDRDDSPSRYDTYLNMFTLPGNELYYSFNYGNAVFICLNSQDPGNTTQYNWLKSTLDMNKDKTWKFVFFHKPFYTSPSHTGDMLAYFNTIWKAFDDYGVDLIFNGHTHNYQRTKPINRNVSTTSPVGSYGSQEGQGRCQIVAGSAGAPLAGLASSGLWWLERTENIRHFSNIEIDGKLLKFKAMDANHLVFDEFTIDKSIIIGTNDFMSSQSRVYPNPSNGEFYIKMPPGKLFSYRIFNSVGQLISELQNSKTSSDPVRIELTNQPRGIYFIELRTETEISIEKIILY